jgi:hypothetical protein
MRCTIQRRSLRRRCVLLCPPWPRRAAQRSTGTPDDAPPSAGALMLSALTAPDAAIIISALVTALLAVVGFAVYLIRYILGDKDAQIAALRLQVAGIEQVAHNAERFGTSLEQVAATVREVRLLMEMQIKGLPAARLPEGRLPP